MSTNPTPTAIRVLEEQCRVLSERIAQHGRVLEEHKAEADRRSAAITEANAHLTDLQNVIYALRRAERDGVVDSLARWVKATSSPTSGRDGNAT